MSDKVHRVRFEPVGVEMDVNEDETVLDAAFRQGISLAHGCKEGQCSSCKSLLIDGDIELLKYSTFALPDYQKDTDHILLCRTLAYSDITVELLNYDEDLMRRSIAVKTFNAVVTGSRPLTHDLMKNFMSAFNIDLQEIIICDLQEGIFYSKLVCFSEHDTVEIDSRTSDALALAVRFGCPIYTYEHILESAGILMEDSSSKKKKAVTTTTTTETTPREDLKALSLEELNTLLNEVLEHEDYIRAIAIRDEINKRKQK